MLRSITWTIAASVIFTVATANHQASAKDIVDTAVDAGSFKTLAAALQAADLVDALKGKGPFTVFAPTDEAFAKLPKGTVENLLKPENKQQLVDVLTYHVVKGQVPASQVVTLNGATSLNGQRIEIQVREGKVAVDDANVVKTDIACSNGLIHVIDQVILPASDDIPTTAVKAGAFNTLIAAVKAAGLAEALSGDGPFTVFAPTDEAFEKLPSGTIDSLLQPENRDKLAAILKYHVVPGRVYSTDAVAAGQADTLQGAPLKIAVNGSTAMVNDAKLVSTDIDASNGVIHVIDSVILPPENATSARPRQMIEKAIGKGAPLYNAGHANACAKIYMETAQNLLAMENHGMCDSTVHTLRTALNQARYSNCSDTQAWTMRHALDMAYRNAQ
jgi:transforming growth factor-beta-induced protein